MTPAVPARQVSVVVRLALMVLCVALQVLRGHSRTPWCVKFNPRDSNILASGCLAGRENPASVMYVGVGGVGVCHARTRRLGVTTVASSPCCVCTRFCFL